LKEENFYNILCDDGLALGIAESQERPSKIVNRKIDMIRDDLRSSLIGAWRYAKRRLDDTQRGKRDDDEHSAIRDKKNEMIRDRKNDPIRNNNT